jgi:two-component system response regulator TctD
MATAQYAVIVLDLGLPDGDATELLPRLVKQEVVPAILILTARGDVDSRIAGLDGGADDYMPKPFSLEEMVARVRALSRRPRKYLNNNLVLGNIAFDRSTREVFAAGAYVALQKAERDLLEQLMLNPSRISTRESLENALFSWDKDFSDNALQLQVHRLRKSLAAVDATIIVETVRGVGYLLREV